MSSVLVLGGLAAPDCGRFIVEARVFLPKVADFS